MTREQATNRLNKLSKTPTRRKDVKDRIRKAKDLLDRSIRQGRPFIPEEEITRLESILFVESIDAGTPEESEEEAE